MNLYVGTSGFSYKEWKGGFYPDNLPDGEMLHFYGQHFLAVEINNTFYRMPSPLVLEAWTKEVPAGFRFVLKAPRRITHTLRLKGTEEYVDRLLQAADVLGYRLGPILFQMPPNFRKDTPRLHDFLAILPTHARAAFEFRHESWFDDEVFHLLRSHHAAMCIAEAEGDLKVPFVSTADWGYLRLRQPDYTDADLSERVERVLSAKWKDAFVFFKHEDEAKAPKIAMRFMELAATPAK